MTVIIIRSDISASPSFRSDYARRGIDISLRAVYLAQLNACSIRNIDNLYFPALRATGRFFFFPGGRARAAYVQRRHATATRKLKVPQNSDAAYTILLTFPMQARIRAHVYLLWLWPYRGRGSCHPRDPPDFEQLAFNPHRISCPLLRERIASIVAPPNCAAVLIRWKKKYILLLIAIIISR